MNEAERNNVFFPEATVKKYDLWTIIQIKNMLS